MTPAKSPCLETPTEPATNETALDRALDEALETTFPASDPVALFIARPPARLKGPTDANTD